MSNDLLSSVVDNTPAAPAKKPNRKLALSDKRIVVTAEQRAAEVTSERPFSWSDGRATDEGFNCVSRDWYKKTHDWDYLGNALEHSAKLNHDEVYKWSDLRLELNGQVKLITPDNQTFRFTDHSLGQLGNLLGLGTRIFSMPEDGIEHDLLNNWVANRWGKKIAADKDSETFVRFRDGKVRAFLSERYLDLPHGYVVDLLQKIIPGGRVSHFSADDLYATEGDFLRFNVLIPDSIRAENDSDYGGMLSIRNSEIGKSRFSSLPSLFRAICMNGLIWSQHTGTATNKVHRGRAFDKDYFAWKLAKDINDQIPLATAAIEQMLTLRACEFGDVCDVSQAIVAVASKFTTPLTRDQQGAIINRVGSSDTMPTGDNAFVLIQAITETIQDRTRFSVYEQDQIEQDCGQLAIEWLTKPSSFGRFCDDASSVDFEKIVRITEKSLATSNLTLDPIAV